MAKNHQNSSELVYMKLKNAIRKRYITQGSQLIEGTLAEKLGVSRTPVRSSIKRLEVEGLVHSIPNRGAFVITPSLEEIKETFFVRTLLEQAAARLAARRITQRQVKVLYALVEKEKEVFNQDAPDDYYEVNDSLHSEIADISGNKVLASYVKELLDKTRTYLILYDPFSKLKLSPSLEAHIRIIEALSNHDPEEASQALADHIKSSVEGLETADLMPEDYLAL